MAKKMNSSIQKIFSDREGRWSLRNLKENSQISTLKLICKESKRFKMNISAETIRHTSKKIISIYDHHERNPISSRTVYTQGSSYQEIQTDGH